MRYKTHGRWKRRLFKRLWKIVKGRCPSCGCQMQRAHGYKNSATLDHIHPQSLGGPTVKRNLQIMCSRCNVIKGSDLQEPWLWPCTRRRMGPEQGRPPAPWAPPPLPPSPPWSR